MPKAVGGWKTCSKCGVVKPVSEFHKDCSCADGLHYWCKTCHQVHDQAYYETNRETLLVQHAEYRVTDAGKVVDKRYKQSDRGKAVGQAATRRYNQTAPSRATISRRNAKRRALKAQAVSALPLEDFATLETQHPVCAYCGREFIAGHRLYKRTLDHIVPLSRGGQHTLDNLVFAHKRCNSQKGTKLPEEWTDRWYEQEEEEQWA